MLTYNRSSFWNRWSRLLQVESTSTLETRKLRPPVILSIMLPDRIWNFPTKTHHVVGWCRITFWRNRTTLRRLVFCTSLSFNMNWEAAFLYAMLVWTWPYAKNSHVWLYEAGLVGSYFSLCKSLVRQISLKSTPHYCNNCSNKTYHPPHFHPRRHRHKWRELHLLLSNADFTSQRKTHMNSTWLTHVLPQWPEYICS